MSHVRSQHPNARLTPRHRRNMVDALLVDGWPVAAVAERFQVDPKTVRKWRDRFVAEGPDGLWDRSSRPRTSPGRTPGGVRAAVVELRRPASDLAVRRAVHPTLAFTTHAVEFEMTNGYSTGADAFTDSK